MDFFHSRRSAQESSLDRQAQREVRPDTLYFYCIWTQKSPNITVIRLLFTCENRDFNETEYLWTIFNASRQAGLLLLQASCVSESLTAVSNVVLPEMCLKVREAEGMRCAADNQSVRNLYLAPSLSPGISHYCPLELLSSSSIPPLPLERCRLQLIEQIATKMKKKTLRKVAVVTREKLEMCIDCSLECKCLSSPRSPPSFDGAK